MTMLLSNPFQGKT